MRRKDRERARLVKAVVINDEKHVKTLSEWYRRKGVVPRESLMGVLVLVKPRRNFVSVQIINTRGKEYVRLDFVHDNEPRKIIDAVETAVMGWMPWWTDECSDEPRTELSDVYIKLWKKDKYQYLGDFGSKYSLIWLLEELKSRIGIYTCLVSGRDSTSTKSNDKLVSRGKTVLGCVKKPYTEPMDLATSYPTIEVIAGSAKEAEEEAEEELELVSG